MEPSVLSAHLKQLAGLIDRSEKPSAATIRAEVASLVSRLEGRQAAKLEKFMDKDFEFALDGIDNLIKKLSKTSQTLNPQDEGKSEIETSLTQLHQLRSGLQKSIAEVGVVNI